MSILDFRWKQKPKPPAPTPVQPVDPPLIDVVPVTPSRPIRVTDERDGEILNRGYSYWPQSWIDRAGAIFVFVGHADGQPKFFRIDPDGTVTRLGPKLSYGGTGEGMYWTPQGDIMLCDGPRLRRVNPFSGADEIVLDISETHPGCRLWQAHSDDSGLCHSATVERIVSDGPYERIGTVVIRRGERKFFQRQGVLDESQIDASGRYVLIKEDNHNIIHDLETDAWVIITQEEGAVGHSDCGPGYVVGEDDAHGACVKWDLAMPMPPEHRRELRSDIWNAGHFSVRAGRCLWSDATNLNLSLLALDGSGATVLFHHGIAAGDYDTQVRANLDPSGRVAAWVSNAAGRFDLYVMRL